MRLLERVRLPDKAHAFPSELSSGQRQRVAITHELTIKPRLMLFDEPTSALDPEMTKKVLGAGRRGNLVGRLFKPPQCQAG